MIMVSNVSLLKWAFNNSGDAASTSLVMTMGLFFALPVDPPDPLIWNPPGFQPPFGSP